MIRLRLQVLFCCAYAVLAGQEVDAADSIAAPELRGPELNWTMLCRGCHGVNGQGTEGGAPNMEGEVSKFLSVEGGREYLVQVPGVAFANMSDAELAVLMNWLLAEFDEKNIPGKFKPYDTQEVRSLRKSPILTGASKRRSELSRGFTLKKTE